MFRRSTLLAAALVAALPLALASPASAAAGEPVPHPDGFFEFGESAVLEYPTGAYPHEYDWDDMREAVFTVDGVQRSPGDPETVRYQLTVEVPELGRVFGMGNVEPHCAVAGHPTGPPTPLPGSVELEAGTHTYDMECQVSELFVALEILFTRADANGQEIQFLFHGPIE